MARCFLIWRPFFLSLEIRFGEEPALVFVFGGAAEEGGDPCESSDESSGTKEGDLGWRQGDGNYSEVVEAAMTEQ